MLISASRRSIFADSTSAGMIVLGCLKKEVMNPEQVRVSVCLEGILLQVVKSSAKNCIAYQPSTTVGTTARVCIAHR
jgi:hypothetical protein